MIKEIKETIKNIKPMYCAISVLGSVILAFGLYNIHAQSCVTEGGVLGLTLLLDHWFGLSPAFSGFVLNMLSYVMGWRLLGKEFLVYSFFSSTGFSVSYKIFEMFDPVWPGIAASPLYASIVGALFVGVSAGICVRAGGAPGGDDALAMSMSKLTGMSLPAAYLLCDVVVLGLSLSYIPISRIAYSFLTVLISGQLVGLMQKIRLPGENVMIEKAVEEER